MKQKILLLTVLTLGMYSINTSAQTKSYRVEDDGFEWYKLMGENGSGAMDKHGKTIVPAQYTTVEYQYGFFKAWKRNGEISQYGFYDTNGNILVPVEYSNGFGWPNEIILVESGEYTGVYNKYGKCIISTNRGYRYIRPSYNTPCSFYLCSPKSYDDKSNGTYSICDASGKVAFEVRNCHVLRFFHDPISCKCILIKDNKFFIDKSGNVLLECFSIKCNAESMESIEIMKSQNSTYRKLTQNEMNKVCISDVFLNGNKDYFAHLDRIGQSRNTLNSQIESSGNNHNNTSESGHQTQTIIVEQHRDPIPVQEWQQCPACYGSGQCPYVNCGGSGWYYIGDRATTCSRCHGSGKCTTCAGRGGQNVTIYR